MIGEWRMAARPGVPGERAGRAEATVWLDRPYRLEAVAVAYFAAREAYAEALAREAGLNVTRNWSSPGGLSMAATGTLDQVAGFVEKLVGHGIGGFSVQIHTEADPAAVARIKKAQRQPCFAVEPCSCR